ncbi:MAG: PIG-L deacetylase family protein [Stellaceae bacterium]
MHALSLISEKSAPLRLLCLGAHADDIEIGCGGTILRLLSEVAQASIKWVVFSGAEERRAEARCSAETFLQNGCKHQVDVLRFPDSRFPFCGSDIKDAFEALKRECEPSLIFTHWRRDAHQDHRVIAELTHNTFRDHLILEYEIPKYDGDLGNPNLFVPLTRHVASRKAEAIVANYPSQHTRNWFTVETFMALARLRGVECNAPDGFAEGFYSSKLVI